MTIERRLLINQLPTNIINSVVQDARLANQPVPHLLIVGFRKNVVRYYRIVRVPPDALI